MDLKLVSQCRFMDVMKITLIIFLSKKTGLSVMTPLNDMLGHAWQHETGLT
jgi:hypothetical protein